MMGEEFDTVKSSYNAVNEVNDIWDNPIVRYMVNCIPFLSSELNDGVKKIIEMHQKKKIEKLFEIILKDNTITIDDIQDVDCIMEFAKTIQVVNRLIRNDKVMYLANLLKHSIKDKDRDVDEFEEMLNKIDNLSLREIDLLYLLYKEEKKISKLDSNGQEVFKADESWKAFINEAKNKYHYNESEVISKMLGIMRTGLCVGEWRTFLSAGASLLMYTSPDYRKLIKIMQN